MGPDDYNSPVTVYIAEGEKLYKAGDYKKAVQAFTTAINILDKDDDKFAMTYVQRSKCYLEMGNAECALDDAEASLKGNKDYARWLENFKVEDHHWKYIK